jgi:phosphatidylglycerophosphate synthase
MDRERLRRIRNSQTTEFYMALVLRPASILITLVIGDWKWVTPNLVTLFATVLRLAGAAMFLVDDRAWLVGGALVLQLGAIFDMVDGTLARYRGTSSNLGYFYDTVSDAISWFAILGTLGWLAYQRSGDAMFLLVASAGGYALMVNVFMKSLVETAVEKRKWRDAVADPVAAVLRNTVRPEAATPPQRSRAEWGQWVLRSLGQIWKFHEMDLFFWVGLFVVLDRIPELLWLIALSQATAMTIQFFLRSSQMHSVDVP